MRSILEKLGITPGPWMCDDPVAYGIDIYTEKDKFNHWIACINTITEGKKKTARNASMIAAAPEMLETLIDIARCDFKDEEDHKIITDIIEKATGMKWEDVKKMFE